MNAGQTVTHFAETIIAAVRHALAEFQVESQVRAGGRHRVFHPGQRRRRRKEIGAQILQPVSHQVLSVDHIGGHRAPLVHDHMRGWILDENPVLGRIASSVNPVDDRSGIAGSALGECEVISPGNDRNPAVGHGNIVIIEHILIYRRSIHIEYYVVGAGAAVSRQRRGVGLIVLLYFGLPEPEIVAVVERIVFECPRAFHQHRIEHASRILFDVIAVNFFDTFTRQGDGRLGDQQFSIGHALYRVVLERRIVALDGDFRPSAYRVSAKHVVIIPHGLGAIVVGIPFDPEFDFRGYQLLVVRREMVVALKQRPIGFVPLQPRNRHSLAGIFQLFVLGFHDAVFQKIRITAFRQGDIVIPDVSE